MNNRQRKQKTNNMNPMKVAYLGKIQLSDTDLPYLNAAQKLCDMTYFMEVTPRFTTGPAYDIKAVYPKSGIFKAVDVYPDIVRLDGFIDIDKFYVVNTFGRFWQLKAFWTNFLLLLFLIKHKYNVIHVTWPFNVYEFVLYTLRKKMVLTVHDPFPHSGLDTFIVRLRRKFAFCLIPKFIILNKTQRQQFLDFYNLKPDSVTDCRMSSCTYLRTVEARMSAIPQKGKYILFIGKISQYKGLDYLLPAMVEVHKKWPDVRMVVAGGGSFHFDISQYKEKEYFEFRNRFIPDDEMVALLKNCLFVVCPYTDATQSGVIMSAFAFGKPVIATNVGGLPEMVRDKEFGLIIKEKSVEALATSISSLLAAPEKLLSYSENIIKAYENGDMSWMHEAKKIQSLYKRISEKI